jgi:hypothetical protein
VLTTNFLGNAIENSLWAISFFLILVALVRLLVEFHGPVRLALGTVILGVAGYIAFLGLVDVPMYVTRWQHDAASGKALLDIVSGLSDAATRWSVTQEVAHWKDEMTWMALYFSIAVWSSLMLCGFELIKHHLPRYRTSSGPRPRNFFVTSPS